MTPLKDAILKLLDSVNPVPAERLDLLAALGRVLGEDVVSGYCLPPFDNSAMDGYAVRCEDAASASRQNPARFAVRGELAAGPHAATEVRAGEAARIMTGAEMPKGADAVVMQEDTREDGGFVLIFKAAARGENVRRRGEDVRAGATVARAGDVVSAALVGLLASVRRSQVAARRKVRVGILSTGNEISYIDESAREAAIVDSNGYCLSAYVSEAGAEPMRIGIARDNEEELRARIESGLSADALVTTGGASVGKYDYVKKTLIEMGIEVRLEKAAIKPGRPFFFGLLRAKPVFVLPGNPAGAAVSFEMFVRPALLKMAGRGRLFRPVVKAMLIERLAKKPGRTHVVRAVVRRAGESFTVEPSGDQGSAIQSSLVLANSLVLLPADRAVAEKGEPVSTVLLDGAMESAEDCYG